MTRDEILEAAAQIFRQKGYHAASMQDIAEAVNLQKASLYHHFNSKQAILAALLDMALDLLIQRLEAVMAEPLSPEKKLTLAIQTYLQVILENQDLASVLLLEHNSLDAVAAARHIPRRDRFERLWKILIQNGLDKGVFASNDEFLVERALFGIMNWTITWYHPEGHLSIDAISTQFAELFLNGLLSRRELEKP
jgi:AcrR family transcriptional regulator